MASLNFKLFIHLHIVIVILHFPWRMCIVHWNLLTPDESCGCPGKTLQPQHKILSLELRAASSRKTDLRTWGRTQCCSRVCSCRLCTCGSCTLNLHRT